MIRSALENDAYGIAETIFQSRQNAFDNVADDDHLKNINIPRFENMMRNNIINKLEDIFVYEDSSRIVGFISGKKVDNNNAEIIGFYIRPEFQKMGIGKKLFVHAVDFYRNMNVVKINIRTLKGARCTDFYLKMNCTIDKFESLTFGPREYDGVVFGLEI